MTELIRLFTKLEAKPEILDWLTASNYQTFSEAWNNCPEPKWIAWLIEEIIDIDERRALAVDIAATSLKFIPEGEDRHRLAVESARAYVNDPTDSHRFRMYFDKDECTEISRYSDASVRLSIGSAESAAHAEVYAASMYSVEAGVSKEGVTALIQQHFPAEKMEQIVLTVEGEFRSWLGEKQQMAKYEANRSPSWPRPPQLGFYVA